MQHLTERDIEVVEETITLAIRNRKARPDGTEEELSLSADFLTGIIQHALIPVLVSMTSRGLYDVLKGRVVGMLSKKEARAVARELIGEPIDSNPKALDPEVSALLRRELTPLGLSESEIDEIVEAARARVAKQPEARRADAGD